MKVAALCIAGQFRDHFDAVWPSLNATLLHAPDFRTEVFVDTWAEPGESTHLPRVGQFFRGEALVPLRLDELDPGWSQFYGEQLVSLKVEPEPDDASEVLQGKTMPDWLIATEKDHVRHCIEPQTAR